MLWSQKSGEENGDLPHPHVYYCITKNTPIFSVYFPLVIVAPILLGTFIQTAFQSVAPFVRNIVLLHGFVIITQELCCILIHAVRSQF
jgi:hypothetical protein